MSYQVKRKAEILSVPVRGLNYRIYRWGRPELPPVFLLHGWADTGMSFQFLADAMPGDSWCLLAPDWRGFGDSDWNQQGYWFPDYLADLEILLDHFARDRPIRLVGHSMGGNVVLLYAGIRPERITHAVTLEQYGLPDSKPETAPDRYAQWLDQWRTPPANLEYDDITAMEQRLRLLAPHLDQARTAYLAPYWCKTSSGKRVISRIDPGHKRVNPVQYRRAEARACWRRITAAVMLVLGAESDLLRRYRTEGMDADFGACFRHLHEVIIPQSGHMLHLDQPELTAAALDQFLRTGPVS
jgi:pimeloyl-ACP methyl ester carboxylesterase